MTIIAERIRTLVAEKLGQDVENVFDGADFAEDLSADSLDALEIVMASEEAFDIEISDDDAERIKTVGGLIRLVEGKAE